MSKSEVFFKQHEEMVGIVGQISAKLNEITIAADAHEVRSLLNVLFGKLNMHLAMEDNTLYPLLKEHLDAKVREIAQKFSAEMGGLKPAVKAFSDKWAESAIKSDPKGFCAATKGLFGVLADRIKRENTELYPLMDK